MEEIENENTQVDKRLPGKAFLVQLAGHGQLQVPEGNASMPPVKEIGSQAKKFSHHETDATGKQAQDPDAAKQGVIDGVVQVFTLVLRMPYCWRPFVD